MRPDFGNHVVEHEGIKLSCRYIVPGLTLQDLTRIFNAAKNNPENDSWAANPSKWPEVAGVIAVTDAILDAIYGKEDETTDSDARISPEKRELSGD